MEITSLDIKNSLSTNRAKIINILDFDSKKLSIIRTKKKKKYMSIMIIIHFFCLLII